MLRRVGVGEIAGVCFDVVGEGTGLGDGVPVQVLLVSGAGVGPEAETVGWVEHAVEERSAAAAGWGGEWVGEEASLERLIRDWGGCAKATTEPRLYPCRRRVRVPLSCWRRFESGTVSAEAWTVGNCLSSVMCDQVEKPSVPMAHVGCVAGSSSVRVWSLRVRCHALAGWQWMKDRTSRERYCSMHQRVKSAVVFGRGLV